MDDKNIKKEIKIIYEDEDLLVVDKPAGIVVFKEGKHNLQQEFLIDILLERHPYLQKVGSFPRWGIVHRLDKETSGILLVAKNNEALFFLQKQFQEKKIEKKYLALVFGRLKRKEGIIKTLIGRSPQNRKKQKVFLPYEPGAEGKREAISYYKVLKNFKNYDLVEVKIKTGRRHQIRVHLAYLGHPIVGDKLYSFKNQNKKARLNRQFLHAAYLKILTPKRKEKEFFSELPLELKNFLEKLD